MRKVFFVLLATGGLVSCAPTARAAIILGPTLTTNETGQTNHGIDFTAVTNSTLTGFLYANQGKADTVKLTLANGAVLQTLSVGAGNPTFTASGLNWSLTAGTGYRLLGFTPNNGRFVGFSFPASSSDLVVNSGVFSNAPHPSFWADFHNITTQGAAADAVATPEPATVAVFGALVLGGAGYVRRRKSAPTA